MSKVLKKAREIAPDDATHYSNVGMNHICLFQVEDGIALYMSINGGDWLDCTDSDFSWELETNEIKKLW